MAEHPHMITDPSVHPAPAAGAAWLKLSAALGEQVPDLAERDDLMVTIAPGAGRGSPGCFIPALASIELDGTHLGADPATCDPARPGDRDRYPALWGVLTHEAAHARHSTWTPPTGTPADHTQAAIILEESRIETAHLRRRPDDRRWLRAATTQIILTSFTPAPAAPEPTTPAPASSAPVPVRAEMTVADAGRAAALLLARADAGILTQAETTGLRAAVTEILGPSRLAALAALWHLAHATADDDAATMIDLGRRWCNIIAATPGKSANSEADGAQEKPQDSSAGRASTAGSESTALADAINDTLTKVASTVTIAPDPATGSTDGAPGRTVKKDRAAEHAARERASDAARRVFPPGVSPQDVPGAGVGHGTELAGTRLPCRDEQAAARQLARLLRQAAHRERATTITTAPTPPGRLNMRGALAADAQRAAGALPTAQPFTRTTRRHTPTPPLRVAIACDVSASMHALAEPVASAAWILAKAASHITDARSATLIFGNRVRPITYPGRAPARVQEFDAADGYEEFTTAIDALDAALDLTRPDAARLLVIVSDGRFKTGQIGPGQQRITRLAAAGCAVLWIALNERTRPMEGAHTITLTDPTDPANPIGLTEAATAIGHAAAHALTHA